VEGGGRTGSAHHYVGIDLDGDCIEACRRWGDRGGVAGGDAGGDAIAASFVVHDFLTFTASHLKETVNDTLLGRSGSGGSGASGASAAASVSTSASSSAPLAPSSLAPPSPPLVIVLGGPPYTYYDHDKEQGAASSLASSPASTNMLPCRTLPTDFIRHSLVSLSADALVFILPLRLAPLLPETLPGLSAEEANQWKVHCMTRASGDGVDDVFEARQSDSLFEAHSGEMEGAEGAEGTTGTAGTAGAAGAEGAKHVPVFVKQPTCIQVWTRRCADDG